MERCDHLLNAPSSGHSLCHRAKRSSRRRNLHAILINRLFHQALKPGYVRKNERVFKRAGPATVRFRNRQLPGEANEARRGLVPYQLRFGRILEVIEPLELWVPTAERRVATVETGLTCVCYCDQLLSWVAVLFGFAVLLLTWVNVSDDDGGNLELFDEWLESVGMAPSDIKERHISIVQLFKIPLHEKRDEHALGYAFHEDSCIGE